MIILIAGVWIVATIVILGAFICAIYITIALYVCNVLFELLEVLRERRNSNRNEQERPKATLPGSRQGRGQ